MIDDAMIDDDLSRDAGSAIEGADEDDATRERSWLQRRLTGAIVWYQQAVDGRPSPCRFTPSCSAYALEAVEVHGSGRGLWLSARRLLRCRPFGPSGFDPVPLAKEPREER